MMSEQVGQNKVMKPILIVTGAAILVGIGAVVYFKYFHNPDEEGSAKQGKKSDPNQPAGGGSSKGNNGSKHSGGKSGSGSKSGSDVLTSPPTGNTIPITGAETTMPDADPLDTELVAEVKKQLGGKGIMLPHPSSVTSWAKKIAEAWGFWNDEEDDVYEVFEQQKDYVSMSHVAAAYPAFSDGVALKKDLESRLSSSEYKHALSLISDKPVYRLA